MPIAFFDRAGANVFGLQVILPPIEAVLAIDAQAGAADGVIAALFGRCVEIKEGQVRAGGGHAVAIEQVIGRRIVLIDGLFDQPHAQGLGVKIEVLLGVCRDSGQMVDAGKFEGHDRSPVGRCCRAVLTTM